MSTYLWIDIGAIIIPLACSFSRRFPFHKEWKYFTPAVLCMALPFLVWDIYFTKMGTWGFNPIHLSGLHFFGLPIEEYLFFLCIPYACVFTYYVITRYLDLKFVPAQSTFRIIGCLLLVLSVIHIDKWYTGLTFGATGAYLLLLSVRSRTYYGSFLLMYLMTLLPFFVVNGLLTGSWISEEVVWYNDSENLGIRLGTIPIEDTVYGFLMLLLTVSLMEKFRSWGQNRSRRQ